MHLSIADRSISLNAREFAEFTTGPIAGGFARFDPMRVQIGQIWHDELRKRIEADSPDARFEISIDAKFVWRGWHLQISGRIDQEIPQSESRPRVREIKTVMRPLPAAEEELRADYPGYFRQLAVYQCTHGFKEQDHATDHAALNGELVFVEPATGVVQVIPQTPGEAETIFHARLDELVHFAEHRRTGLERLQTLSFKRAFAEPRPGQETILEDLKNAAMRSPAIFFEAPTGFGKTGCALEYALGELASGRLTRVIYLTGKSTGQLQVVRQLAAMVGEPPGATSWQIRNKAEHCINEVYHCFREACGFLDGQEERWPASGLNRFAHDSTLSREIDAVRIAGRGAHICPYEITRASLPFTDIWIADYNYIFSPSNRSFLENLPGFEPQHTLLVIDEAHNLPSRVADSHSTELTHAGARIALSALDGPGVSHGVVMAWEQLTLFLARIKPADSLDPDDENELFDLAETVVKQMQAATIDYCAIGPAACDALFHLAALHENRRNQANRLPELVWAPTIGEVQFTCLDASKSISDTLHNFGHVLFLSATLSPVDVFARQCGFDSLGAVPEHLLARTPWRDNAYDVGIDVRVDTRYRTRARHYKTTAATLARVHAASDGPIVAFFPSYAYAGEVLGLLEKDHPELLAVLQPRGRELAAQQTFLEESLLMADIMLLVLGSGFSESIDVLGGRVAACVVVGPALPQVNAVQKGRSDAVQSTRDRETAFREVYQIPGMQKVNQALGRLVRAPGQRARILLHCERFADRSYSSLLAPEYRKGTAIVSDADLDAWLSSMEQRVSGEK